MVVAAREWFAVGSTAGEVDVGVGGHLLLLLLMLLLLAMMLMMNDEGRVDHGDERDAKMRALTVDGDVGDEHAQCHHTSTAAYTHTCLLYTSPSPRDRQKSRMPSSA